MQDGAIAAEGGGQVDFVLVLDAGGRVALGAASVDGEGEVGVDFLCDVRLEEQRDGGVGGVDVVCVFDYGGVDVVIVVFAHDEDVARGAGPFEGEEVLVVCLCVTHVRCSPVTCRYMMAYP